MHWCADALVCRCIGVQMSPSAQASQKLSKLLSLYELGNKANTCAALCKGGPLHTDKMHKPRRGFLKYNIKCKQLYRFKNTGNR